MFKTLNYEQTKYPKLFKDTYWGHHYYGGHKIQIIENRNKFVIEYQIKKQSITIPYAQDIWAAYDNGFDHKEYYNLLDGRVLMLISPYKGQVNSDEKFEKNFKVLGYELIYPLYIEEANSYIKIFSSRKELNSFLKKWSNYND